MKQARKFLTIAVFALVANCLWAQGGLSPAAGARVWVASWGASQQIPEPQNALPADDLRDATVRQIFHLSVGGSALRVHLSNVFGTEALHFESVHIARPLSPSSSAIDISSDRPLTFAGKSDVTVPPGSRVHLGSRGLSRAAFVGFGRDLSLDAPPSTRDQAIQDRGRPPITSMGTL